MTAQPVLVLYPGTTRECRFALAPGVCKAGRSRSADVRIDNPNVSGIHLSLQVSDTQTELFDLDSTNGTTLNGKKVTHAVLANGDRIGIADCDAIFRLEQTQAATVVTAVPTVMLTPVAKPLSQRLTELSEDSPQVPGATELKELAQRALYLERTAKLLESLNTLMSTVMGRVERGAVIEALLKELSVILEFDLLGLFAADEKMFYLLRNGLLSRQDSVEGVSTTVLEKVIATGEPVMIEHLGQEGSGFASLLRFKVQSLLAFPVCGAAGEVLGVIYCVERESQRINRLYTDREFVASCSHACSLALQNCALLEQLREKTRREERSIAAQHYSPQLTRLSQQRENLALKLERGAQGQWFGLDQECNSDIRHFVEKAARTDLPVLLSGETGTGKSIFAALVHERSGLGGPLVTIDCTTIPFELIESELFGHEKGAFTGAHVRKVGKIAGAQEGTLFLDEIGELPLNLQSKLLRFIQSGEYEPVGATRTVKAHVRLVFATNRNLRREVEQKTFREDLYFRLNVLELQLPALRSRPEMIMQIANFFLERNAPRLNPGVTGFAPNAQDAMLSYAWPGNARELENAVMRALVNATGAQIEAVHLVINPGSAIVQPDAQPALHPDSPSCMDLKLAREQLDRALISRALHESDRNVSQAARLLSISRNSLMDLMKKYSL